MWAALEAAPAQDLFTNLRDAGVITGLIWAVYRVAGPWVSATLKAQRERAQMAEDALAERLQRTEQEAAGLRDQILQIVRGEHEAKLEARDLAAQVAVGAAERRVLEVERDGAFAARDASIKREGLLEEKAARLEEDVEALKRILNERTGTEPR